MSELFSSRYAKFWTAFVGFLAHLVAAGVVPIDYVGLTTGVIAFLTALGVVAVPNTPPAGQAPNPRFSEQG